MSKSICTGALNETRMIGGVAVTRPCWEYAKNYQCQTVIGGGNDCGPLETNASCTLDREICLDDPAERCLPGEPNGSIVAR